MDLLVISSVKEQWNELTRTPPDAYLLQLRRRAVLQPGGDEIGAESSV